MRAAVPEPVVISSERGVSSWHPRVRLASYALNYLAGIVDSTFSSCAAVSVRGTPDSHVPVVYRLSPGSSVDPGKFINDYWRLGKPMDPFRIGRSAEPQPTFRGPGDFGGLEKFARHPFAMHYLARHGIGSRTAIYLRDRDRVKAVIALDRAVCEPDLTEQEKDALVRLAPLLGQAVSCGAHLHASTSAIGEAAKPPLNSLTERELQVARMVARGLNNDEIAQELALSSGTVKVHLGRTYSKTGARSRAELVTIVLAPESWRGRGMRAGRIRKREPAASRD